jgi:hypothetical protein
LPLPLKNLTLGVFTSPCLVLGEESHRFVTEELLVPENQYKSLSTGTRTYQHQAKTKIIQRVNVLFFRNLSDAKVFFRPLKGTCLTRIHFLEVTLAGGGNILTYEALKCWVQ